MHGRPPANAYPCSHVQWPGALATRAGCHTIGPASSGSFLSKLRVTVQQLSSLPALLEAMMPPAAQPEYAVTLEGRLEASPAAAALPSTSAAAQRLAGLRKLCLCPENQDASVEVLLQAMVPYAAQQLTCLKVEGRIGPQLPPCVAQLTGLRRLVLNDCGLTQLPGGPFLARELAMCTCV